MELAALCHELQFLVGGKISQIYHDDELVLQLHVPGKGKQLLKIIPGKLLCLTTEKNAPVRPSGFCMQLRKYINNAVIRSFFQKDAERIVIIDVEKEDKFKLILELFPPGNIILTDETFLTIGTLQKQHWKDRVVKNREQYQFPPEQKNWKNITPSQLKELLKTSEKRNLATALATELGLGGVYAEEICRLAGVDKNLPPAEGNAAALVQAIRGIQELLATPHGYFYEDHIAPFPLTGKSEQKITETYNEAINTLNPQQKSSPYEHKIIALKNRIEQQENAIKEQEEKIQKNTAGGERMYEQYTPLQKLLSIVGEMRKNVSWSDIERELRKEKKITSIDLKNKKIRIEL